MIFHVLYIFEFRGFHYLVLNKASSDAEQVLKGKVCPSVTYLQASSLLYRK